MGICINLKFPNFLISNNIAINYNIYKNIYCSFVELLIKIWSAKSNQAAIVALTG